MAAGPSPRARGSRLLSDRSRFHVGSIPACAGQSNERHCGPFCLRVHPRVRGAVRETRLENGVTTGPSPRARGSPRYPELAEAFYGSIPACAGQSSTSCQRPRRNSVHPRVRGAVPWSAQQHRQRSGPSPRARGSHSSCVLTSSVIGSIPACAGQSPTSDPRLDSKGVHPRVRGAVAGRASDRAGGSGPSPRARGSLRRMARHVRDLGSIPACAGQSRPSPPKHDPSRVHPRVRGAVRRPNCRARRLRGPSPRARGSLSGRTRRPRRDGSIPACAGQSSCAMMSACMMWVHPRVRGAVAAVTTATAPSKGPSPRARGSPSCAPRMARLTGSIPACAGQSWS